MPTLAQEELQRLLQLLKTEKEEDFRQYELYIKNTSLQQRKQAGLCWYPVEIKETGYGLGDYPYVVVERPTMRDQPHQFSGGKLASVFTGNEHYSGESAQGTIHFVSGNTMKIVLGGNELPDWISEGKIGVNVSFDERSYREMEEAVKRVIKAEEGRLAELREIILGDRPAQYNNATHIINIPSLNDSQNQAVNRILAAQDIAVMHGPPGTGKTTTLVQAIKQLSKTESTILVCAPSNAAVDLLTERLSVQGLNVVRIGNLARVDEEMLQYTLEGRLEGHTYAKDVKRLKKQADEYRRMATKYKRQFGREEREQRNLLLKEARNLVQDATKLEDYAVMDILNKADVVTCTLVGSVNRYLEGKKFETVVIDEAAQALEPATWIPIAKAGKVVLSGDPFQLPPTVKSVEASKSGLSTTLIEKCLNRLPEVSLLKVQYRMHQAIMGFSNREFYSNELQADDSVAGHTIDLPDNAPLVFIDTAGCSFDEKQNPETQSLYNPGEFDILRRHLDAMLAPAQGHTEVLPGIGIISPYREQVKYIREQLEKDPEIPEGLDLDIDTIDSFQGQERDVIYISLVRSNDKSEIGFLADYRRMNVAMTRARKKLVVIGDSATLGQHRFYLDFLEYVEDVGAYHSAWEWMSN